MKKRLLSTLCALVFVAGLVPALTGTALAENKLETPVVQLNGKTVIWRPVDNAQSYEIEVIYKLEGAGEAMAVQTLVSVSADGAVTDARAYIENSSNPTDVQTRLQYVDFINSYVLNLDELIPYYHAALYRCQIRASGTGYASSDTVSSGKISGKELAEGYATPFTLGGKAVLSSDTGEFTPGAKVTVNCTGGTFDEISASELRYGWEVRSAPGETGSIIPGANENTYTIEDQYDGKQVRVIVTSETRSGTVCSDWYPMPIDPNTHFLAQPKSGAAKKSEEYSFSWELSGPVKAVVLQVWFPEDNDWASMQSIMGNSFSVQYSKMLAENDVSRYRLLVGLGGSHFFSDEFTVTWTEDASTSTAFIAQPQSGTAKKTEYYTFTWSINGSADKVYLQQWLPSISDWGTKESLAGLTSWSVSYLPSDGNESKYRIWISSENVFSDVFTVTWTDGESAPVEFTKQPASGTAKQSEAYPFSWELSGPVDGVVLYSWIPEIGEWGAGGSQTGNSGSLDYHASLCEGNVSRHKLHVSSSDGPDFFSDEFTVTWTEDAGEPPGPTHTVNTGSLSVRESPDSESARIGGLTEGADVVVVETQGDWSRIVYSDGYGWVMSKYLTPKGEAEKPNPFTDVSKSDLCYDAVLWAYYHDPQITDGMTDTTFGPELTVTRGQCVAFLWRAMGKPEPAITENPFTDVPASQYYYKPVLWAVEKGITDGVTDTTFAPDATLTTQHIVTFLYRTLNPGKDGWDGEASAWAGKDDGGKPFGVDIAVNNQTDCPRWCVVQFLYKTVK